MTAPALAQDVRGKGRHYQNPKTGDLVPSVTNIIGLMDKPALPRWSAKMVAETAWRMRGSLQNMEENEAVDMLKGSPWSKSRRASERGTDIHEYLEAGVNAWQVASLSPDALPYQAAADAWLMSSEIEPIATELTVFHPKYAGTLDFVGMVDRRLTILDWKTSKAIYDEAALQLAALFGCLTDQHGDPVPWRDESGAVTQDVDLIVVRIGEDKHQTKQVADPDGALAAFHGLISAWDWKHTKAYL